MRTAAVYKTPLREAIHRLKYKHDIGLGEALSHYLIELYDSLDWKVDMVVPVPLSPSKLQERGYNQSSLLAWPLAKWHNLLFLPSAIQRIRNTRPQVELSAKERRENVKDAFFARDIVRGKRILVIDDVTTTGSTIQACCKALINAQASEVYAMTLARAVIGDDTPPEPDPVFDQEQPVQTLY